MDITDGRGIVLVANAEYSFPCHSRLPMNNDSRLIHAPNEFLSNTTAGRPFSEPGQASAGARSGSEKALPQGRVKQLRVRSCEGILPIENQTWVHVSSYRMVGNANLLVELLKSVGEDE
jgi:hypothetical protein